MKRFLWVALLVLPLFLSPAWAATERNLEPIRAIGYLGEHTPAIDVVSRTHMPVPSGSNGIGPGSQLIIERPDGSFICTSNFIWKSHSTGTMYLGAAGHCFLPEGKTSTHGFGADYNPSLTKVFACYADCDFGGQAGPFLGSWGEDIRGQYVQLGPVAYARQTWAGQDVGQDFGLAEVPVELHGHIRPEVPVWGGPSKVQEISQGAPICVYGNGAVTGETFLTKARSGLGLAPSTDGKYWRGAFPSNGGDSGSAVLTCGPAGDGMHGIGAAGILTHIGILNETARTLGTTVRQAAFLTRIDAGLSVEILLEDGQGFAAASQPSWSAEAPSGNLSAVWESFEWTAGPFTRDARIDPFDGCTGVKGEDSCDYHYVQVNVPSGGATLEVQLQTESAESDDFDLYIWRPDGQPFGSSDDPGTPPEVVASEATQSGTYTIAVNPWSVVDARYTGLAALKPPPNASIPPLEAPLSGEPRIYQGSVIDPMGVLGQYVVLAGTPVGLSVRNLVSNDPGVDLSQGFEATHVITKDGQVAFGPFECEEGSDGGGYRTDSDWNVPLDAEPGDYVFEAYVTVSGVAYLAASLPFTIQ